MCVYKWIHACITYLDILCSRRCSQDLSSPLLLVIYIDQSLLRVQKASMSTKNGRKLTLSMSCEKTKKWSLEMLWNCRMMTWSGLGVSQSGIYLLMISRNDSFPTWQSLRVLGASWGLEPVQCHSTSELWTSMPVVSSAWLSSCCIRFCQKAALEKLLISGSFMA